MNPVLVIGLLMNLIALPIVGRRLWFLFRLIRNGQPAPDRIEGVTGRLGRAIKTEVVEVLGQPRSRHEAQRPGRAVELRGQHRPEADHGIVGGGGIGSIGHGCTRGFSAGGRANVPPPRSAVPGVLGPLRGAAVPPPGLAPPLPIPPRDATFG